YFNLTTFPEEKDMITADLTSLGVGVGQVQTKGFKVPMGQSRTFQVGYFSDAAMAAPWTLSAVVDQAIAQDQNGNNIANGTVTVTIDKMMGVNGQKANVTVTPTAFSPLGVVYFYLKSKSGNTSHYLPILIGSN